MAHILPVVVSFVRHPGDFLMPNRTGFGYHGTMSRILARVDTVCQPPSMGRRRNCPFQATVGRVLLMALLGLQVFLYGPSTVHALPVNGLYNQLVEVADQSDGERRRAYREAFSQVIVKVSGDRRWLDHPAVRGALTTADNYVAEVAYRSSGSGTAMEVSFDQQLVDDLLVRAEIPVWGRNRASVLLWLTVQNTDGRRVMLASSNEHELLEQARAFSEERAVPVLVPLLDLVDRRMVSLSQSWAMDADALRSAAERYGADSILAARLLEMPGGQLVGLWQFIFRDQSETFDHVSSVGETYMDPPLDRATSHLARHFGLLPRDLAREDEVVLRVDGIDDLNNHMILVRYLESLALVREVRIAGLRPEGLDLHVKMVGDRYRLTELISLDRDLRPEGFELGGTVGDTLHYRWTR